MKLFFFLFRSILFCLFDSTVHVYLQWQSIKGIDIQLMNYILTPPKNKLIGMSIQYIRTMNFVNKNV